MAAFSEGLNRVDYTFLTILFVFGFTGLIRGGMREIVSLLSWFAGFVIALTFAEPLAKIFSNMSGFTHMADSASQTLGVDATSQVSLFAVGVSVIVLFAVTVFIGALIGRVLTGMVEAGGASVFNRLIGIFMGLGRGGLLSLVMIFVAQLTPIASGDNWQSSKMIQAYQPSVKFFSKLVGPSLENLKKRAAEGYGSE